MLATDQAGPITLLVSILFLVLAMLAKSSAATVPLAAIALDRWAIGRSWRSVLSSGALIALAAVPFVAIAIIAHATGDLAPNPLWRRPLIAGDSLGFYLGKTVLSCSSVYRLRTNAGRG